MSEKATPKTLARTMYALLTAILCITVVSQETAVANPPAKAEIKIKTITSLNKSLSNQAKKLLPASQRPAPKELKARGRWLKEILYEAGFRGKNLKTAWAIAMKESTGRPTAYNGNRSTGDSSYGLFQINMIGSLGPSRRAQFNLKTNNDLFRPLTNAKAAFHMSGGGKNWSAWDIDSSGYNGGRSRGRYLTWLKQYPEG